MDSAKSSVKSILDALYSIKLLSILVEGGAKLLQTFLDENSWDEIRIITNRELEISDGIASPEFSNAKLVKSEILGSDIVTYFKKV